MTNKTERWRAKKGGMYWLVFVGGNGLTVREGQERGNGGCNADFRQGNYFRTRARAREAKRRMQALLAEMHKEAGR